MVESIFGRLFTYRETNKKSPRENYLTEIISWLINNNASFAKDYVELLIHNISDEEKRARITEKDRYITEYSCETQIYVSKGETGIIDSVVFAEGEEPIGFICEHKIGSNLRKDQLSKYRDNKEEIRKNDRKFDYVIVLLTKTKEKENQNPDVELCWSDVYKWFDEKSKEYSDVDKMMVEQFLTYLTEEGMGAKEIISKTSVVDYPEAMKLPKRLKSIFSDIQDEMKEEWEEKCPGINDYVVDFKKVSVKQHWGRLGLEFSDREDWKSKPGLFAGVVLDNDDHQLRVNGEYTPQFVVLMDRELDESDYKEKEDDIRSKINEQFEGDSLGGFRRDDNPKNRWRLYILKKPFADIVCDEDYDKQKDKIKQEIIDGLNIILGNLKTGDSKEQKRIE